MFFSMKALRKHVVVDTGLTIRTESVSLGLSCRQDIFIVTVFHTGKSEAVEFQLSSRIQD